MANSRVRLILNKSNLRAKTRVLIDAKDGRRKEGRKEVYLIDLSIDLFIDQRTCAPADMHPGVRGESFISASSRHRGDSGGRLTDRRKDERTLMN